MMMITEGIFAVTLLLLFPPLDLASLALASIALVLGKAMRSARVKLWHGAAWHDVLTPFPVAYRQRGISVL